MKLNNSIIDIIRYTDKDETKDDYEFKSFSALQFEYSDNG